MIGKPKVAKAVAKPKTGEESIAVKKALREKYPQMSEAGWGVVKAIKKAREESKSSIPSVAEHRALSQKSLEEALDADDLARYTKRKETREGTRKKSK